MLLKGLRALCFSGQRFGCVAEWLKAPDCKPGLKRHGGSNPPAPTNDSNRRFKMLNEVNDIIETTRKAWGL